MPAAAWERALRALHLLAADPAGLGGVLVRARPGPARDAFQAAATRMLGPPTRLPVGIGGDQLSGAVDLATSLAEGRLVTRRGLLDTAGPMLLAGAERATPLLAARLAAALDAGRAGPVIAFDESASAEEGVPGALAGALALHVDLHGLAMADCPPAEPDPAPPALSGRPPADTDVMKDLAQVAAALGIDSAAILCRALRTAQASAALAGRTQLAPPDMAAAIELVLAPRALHAPAPPEDAPEPDAPAPDAPADESGSAPTPPDPPDDADPATGDTGPDCDVAAIRAALPADLLERLAAQGPRHATGAGHGAQRMSRLRGRPLPSRPGRPDGRSRIDVVATLRAAAPWQRLRRDGAPDATGLIVRPADIHLRRHAERAERLLIFTVDASGSAAMGRLAEAKGAVELLLARAHSTRDHVALVAFRGSAAQVLLPPTRSLVRTKRELAQLPGGGATPLAAGLRAAFGLATTAARRGMSPVVALLTDGRGNVALDGTAGRARAEEDARAIAEQLARAGIDALLIDTATRPDPQLRGLAEAMRASYTALPRASASGLSDAVTAGLGR